MKIALRIPELPVLYIRLIKGKEVKKDSETYQKALDNAKEIMALLNTFFCEN